ncbi:MAG: hypothetical protein ABW346_07825 [Terrimicrobium sp.]
MTLSTMVTFLGICPNESRLRSAAIPTHLHGFGRLPSWTDRIPEFSFKLSGSAW